MSRSGKDVKKLSCKSENQENILIGDGAVEYSPQTQER